ncbi:Bacteriophytochrome [Orbilia brochopaga]|nr:Bacteriophytochrome [Drechslerella brochopaga]
MSSSPSGQEPASERVTPRAVTPTSRTPASAHPIRPGISPYKPRRPPSTGPPSPSTASDALSPDAVDRVFPMRSVVGVDSYRKFSGTSVTPSDSDKSSSFSPRSEPPADLPGDTVSIASILSTSRLPSASNVLTSEEAFVTKRFSYQHTSDGHMVITGIAGAESIQKCEDEPIHCPGAVQGFGALLVLKQDPKNPFKLAVRIASENSATIIGYSPKSLFALSSFTQIISDEQAENLLDHIDFTRGGHEELAQNGPEVFLLILTGPDALQIKLWCATHIDSTDSSLVICEFELEDDHLFPVAAGDDEQPSPAESTLDSDPTEEELLESTTSLSKPLRVLRHARRRPGAAAAMEAFNILAQIQEQLASAPDLARFLKVLVGVIKELTGFHRVMIYQFDEAWNGKVVSELVDYRATKDLYKGLNFPASDIPKQARDLYKLNKVRLLYDRDQVTARLVCKTAKDLEVPLDMTHTYLRAMSPIHIKYLANMAVRASMSVSITSFGELWGLISCHTYGTRGMRVPFPIRKLCRVIGESASRNIERLSYSSRLQARKLINTVPTETNPSGYIIASSDDLLQLFDADYGLLSIRDETKVLGHLDDIQEALALVEYFRIKCFTSVTTSQQLLDTFPDLKYPPGFKNIAGALLVPLSGAGKDFIAFFRRGQLRRVHWAGNPYEKTLKEGTTALLEPRKSFKIWSETVASKSKEWTDDEIETAAVLCLVYGKFIEVWRQKEAALQTSQLTRILLANASHEVRTPLNAIINYLEIAMEGPLDIETRENLARSHSASKSLIYVINDLLDLTRTEEGHNLIKDEFFDISATVREATDSFRNDAIRKGIEFKVIEHPGAPQFVKGDQSKVRQAIANLSANAISHTTTGGVKVELWASGLTETVCDIEIAVQDTGIGMSAKKLDKLFREMEQVQTDIEAKESHTGDFSTAAPDSDRAQREGTILGLGLAVVARIVRNMNGQLRLKSEEGKGSRFCIQIPFTIPDATPLKPRSPSGCQPLPSPLLSRTPTLEADPSERTLVRRDNLQQPTAYMLGRRNSAESMHSNHSSRSATSNRSAVDRLLESFSGAPEEPPPINIAPASAIFKPVGFEPITDAKTPVRALKVEDDNMSPNPTPPGPSRASTYRRRPPIPTTSSQSAAQGPESPVPKARRPSPCESDHKFHVLVAEDDLVNSKIIQKRLEKLGHKVTLTVNGEQCAALFAERGGDFDAVLMDIQMPIADGYASTRKIRRIEAEDDKAGVQALGSQRPIGRIPIVAVSASLLEKDRQFYTDCGFDAWILKPVDFKRLNVLLDAILNKKARSTCLYKPGQWERGGWFGKCRSD